MNQEKIQRTFWLRVLFYIQVVTIALSSLSQLAMVLPLHFSGAWISRTEIFLSLAMVLCLFMLPWYYRLSAICKAVFFLFSLYPYWLPYLIPVLSEYLYFGILRAIGWVLLVLALVSQYLEYSCHGRTAPQLKKLWLLLFGISSVISSLSQLMVLVLQNRITPGSRTMHLYNSITLLLGLGISVFYLVLLHRTITISQKEET